MYLNEFIGEEIAREHFDLAGSLGGWREIANMCFAPGCEAQSVFVLASFAAPLMALLNTQEGGAFVALYGGKKAGKDFAALVAETVWGPPGFLVDTPEEQGNLPVLLKGLVRRDPMAAHKVMAGLLLKSDAVVWRTLFLTTNPVPLFPVAFGPGALVPGLEYQVKVPAALIDPKADKLLTNQLVSNRGQAGLVYLRYLTRREVVNYCRRAMISKIGALADVWGQETISQRRFEARAVAAISVAAEVVQKVGVIDVDPGRIERWMLDKTFPQEKAA